MKNQLKALKNIVAAKTYNEVVNLLIRQYDAKSYYEPMLTLVLDRLDTIEHKINVMTIDDFEKNLRSYLKSLKPSLLRIQDNQAHLPYFLGQNLLQTLKYT